MIFGRGILGMAFSDYGLKMALQNRHTIAIDLFTKALELDDSDAAYWTNRGATYYSCENFEQANLDLTRALTINPSQEVARAYRGFIRFDQGDYLGSLEDLNGIEFSEAQHATAALFRGCANEQLGNWQQAIDDYRRSYELDRSQKVAAISIARIQAGCPDDSIRDGRKALENAETICTQTEWKDWMVVSVYAAAWAEVGDFESACKYAQMALDLAPENEKLERASRLNQFQKRIPFRILQTQQQT
jgi:tetratricopeptide (TPR) repeat protein